MPRIRPEYCRGMRVAAIGNCCFHFTSALKLGVGNRLWPHLVVPSTKDSNIITDL